MNVRALVVAVAVFAGGAAGDLRAQRDLVGIRGLEPVQLHPLVIDQLPRQGRELDGFKLALHKSVPLEVGLVPTDRPEAFMVVSRPDLRIRKFIVPGLLNATLSYGGKRSRPHRWEIRPTKTGLEMFSHSGASMNVLRHDVIFLDLNHDGAFGGASDGYIAKGPDRRQWVRPGEKLDFRGMRSPCEIEGHRVWFEVSPEGFRAVVTTKEPDYGIERNEDYAEALAFLNGLRAKLGFDPVALDPELSLACEKHSLYCSLNGTTHHEDLKKPGYSKDGARAGLASVLVPAGSMKQAVADWLSTFYHRIGMLRPDLTAVGMGWIGGSASMDVISTRLRKDFAPFVWPPDGATDVPVGWRTGEEPNPVGPGPFTYAEASSFGHPISVTFPDAAVSAVSAQLLRDGKPLNVFVSAPDRPGNSEIPDNDQSILVMAQAPLTPGVTYEVVVECTWRKRPWSKRWSFTTAAR